MNAHPTQVVCAILIKEGKAFCARRSPDQSHAGLWEFPGGKLEQGETPQQALEREMQEEFGVFVKAGKILAQNAIHKGEQTILLLAVQCQHIKGDFTPTVHDQIQWTPFHELPQLNWSPGDIPFLDLFKKTID